ELACRLERGLPLLTSGQRGGRHRTLRDAIGWSHDLCSPAERSVWARLSLFAGPFTMSAAEELCADVQDAGQVMPTVVRLVDKSVIVRIDPVDAPADGTSGGSTTRYRMLGIIREFGTELLDASGGALGIRRRFVARYLAMAREFRDHFLDDDQVARLHEMHREHANLIAALDYAFGQGDADGVELATVLSVYWHARGLAREGARWLAAAADRAPEGSPARGHAVVERGFLLFKLGDAPGALACAARAIELAAQRDDEALAARGYLVKAAALCGTCLLTAAGEATAEARSLLCALDDRQGLATLETQLTYLALLDGNTEAALGHVERGQRQLGGSRERWLHGNLYMLASLALYLA
ncbi:MAG: ATP-binding protein, partial [Solirubrobacteraceae bacterium]